MKNIYFYLVLFISFFTINEVKATHLLGADISYECIGPNQYRVTLVVYRDCNGVNVSTSQTVNYSSATCGVSASITLNRIAPPVDITPLCATEPSACSGSGNYGIQENIYQGVITLPPGCGDDWVLGWSQCCRNNAINTLSSPGNQNMGVSSQLDNTLQPCNNSPTFNNEPASILCINQPFVFNHGVSDVDGDSLFFSLSNCFENIGNQVNYSGGFSGANPLSTASGVTINPNTGALSFTPTQQQVGVLCVQVEEYRDGVKIGEVNRDMQFRVINCSNVPPQATGVDGAPNNDPVNFETSICANSEICFEIFFNDDNTTDNLTVSWNQEISGATFTVVDNGTLNPVATFCWQPVAANIGQNIFSVNVVDDACPVVGSGTYTYIVTVTPSPNTLDAGIDQTICLGETANLSATANPAPLSYTWSPPQTLNTSNGQSVQATPLVTTSYEVAASFPDGCDLTDIVVVTVAPDPVVTVTPLNPFNCLGQNNELTATATNAVSYEWQPGGFPTQTINVAPPVTTTYTATATSQFGCTGSASTTVSIAEPQDNVCNVLYVTPTGSPFGAGTRASPMDLETAMTVGACNGTIIKMAIGDYVTDTTINRVTSYLTLEGGYDDAVNWEKVSTAGATRILRTATMTTSTVNGNGVDNEAPPYPPNPSVTTMNVNGQTGFRFQDLTIEVQGLAGNSPILGYRGVTTTSLELQNCDGYNIVRTRIRTGAASDGSDEGGGTNPTPGGSSYGIHLINNGTGGNIISSNVQAGAAGAGGEFVFTNPGNFAANGTSQAIFSSGGGSGLAQNQSTFNLDAQPVIRMDDISCTNLNIDFSAGTSWNWTFGTNSVPGSANGSNVTTYYTDLGRKNINFNSNNYIGFANILLEDQVIPDFSTSAPIIDGEYRVCAGDSVNFTALNGGVGYTYIWSDGTNTITGTGSEFQSFTVPLDTPGVFTITLNYETSCCGLSLPADVEIFVEENPDPQTPGDQELCFGGTTGVVLDVTGGTTGGSIAWQPSAGLSSNNSYTVTALPNSTTTYEVVLTDSTGLCVENTTITVDVIDIELSTTSLNASCGPDGSAEVTVTGGGGTYDYLWSPGGQTDPSLNNLQVGTYGVLVTDVASGCQDSTSATVNANPGTLVGFIVNSQNISCFGESDGQITVQAIDGIPPYTFAWSNGVTNTWSNTLDSISGLTEGQYDVLITDDVGCTYEVTGFVSEPLEVNFDIDSIFDPSCEGVDDGFIQVTTDGGVAPFTYEWTHDPAITDNFTSDLGSGTYTIIATDFNGCVDSLDVTIQAPPIPETVIDTTLCEGDNYDLIAGGQLTLLNDTTLFDTIVALSGCLEAITTNITVLPLPNVAISGDTTLCSGEEAVVFFTGLPGATVTYNTDGVTDLTIVLDALGEATINTGPITSTLIYNLTEVSSPTTPVCSQTLNDTATITVLDLPTATIAGGDTTICNGEEVNITFTGTPDAIITYNVDGNPSVTATLDNTGNFVVSTTPSSLTTYELESVELAGTPNCIQTIGETINIDVREIPVANIASDTTICNGETVDVTFTGTPDAIITYNVDGNPSVSATLDNTGNFVVSITPTSSTTYELESVELAGAPNCIQTIDTTITITVLDLPTASISGDSTICDGDDAVIQFSGTPDAIVTYNNGGPSTTVTLDNTGNANINTGALNADVVYQLESVELAGTPNCAQTITGTTTITVLELPFANISGDTAICDGENSNILFEGTPDAIVTYTVDGGAPQTVTLDAAGEFILNTGALSTDVEYEAISVELQGTPNCVQTLSDEVVNIAVSPLPTASISGTSACEGETTTIFFEGTPNTTVTYTVNGGLDETILLDASGEAQLTTPVLTTSLTYDLVQVAYNTAPNCVVLLSESVTVNPLQLPTATIDGATTLCQGDSTVITFTGTANAEVTFTVNGNNDSITLDAAGNASLNTGPISVETTYELVEVNDNGCIEQVVGQAIVSINPTYTETVNVTICSDETYDLPDGTAVNVEDTYVNTFPTVSGCDSTIITNLTVNQLGTFDSLENQAFCEGFSETVTINAQNMVSFEWFYNQGSGNISTTTNDDFIGGTTNTLTYNILPSYDSTEISVNMVDECGNNFTESFLLRIYEPSPVDNPIGDFDLCEHTLPEIITVDYNGNNYIWNTGTLGSSISVEESGTYIVDFIENETNCRLSDTIEVTIEDCIANCVLLAPTAFSPDENNVNDVFRAVTTCEEGFSFYEFTIYNRWGELVYQTNDYREGWDGNYKGRTAEIGVYTYYIEYVKNLTNQTESLKGNVTLIR